MRQEESLRRRWHEGREEQGREDEESGESSREQTYASQRQRCRVVQHKVERESRGE